MFVSGIAVAITFQAGLVGTALAKISSSWSVAASTTTSTATRLPVSQLKIVNYYPADDGWTNMWTSYSHDKTVTDFQAIASLGANTVRIIVAPAAMGYPTVTSTRLAEFRDMLAVARAQGLSIQLTLFDMWHNYTDITGSQQWLNSLLSGQAQNPTIALVELQNELPLGTSGALTWAGRLLPQLSTLLPGVPRTVSVSGSSGIAGIVQLISSLTTSKLDVVDVHYYGDAAGAANTLQTAVAHAQGRPVIVGEAGLSTVNGAAGEEAQARFYRMLARITQSLGIPPAAPWILSDFTSNAIPYSASQAEYHYGLRRLDGTWKPAAAAVRDAFAGRMSSDVDGSFEREANGGITLGSWTAFDTADGLGFVTPLIARSGRVALCFNQTGGSSAAWPSVEQAFPVITPHQTVTASGYVFRHQATGIERISLAWFDATGRYLGQNESPYTTLNNRWVPLKVSAAAPAGATAVQVHLKAAHESGYGCYDDIAVSW
jgi:hypothetical protein